MADTGKVTYHDRAYLANTFVPISFDANIILPLYYTYMFPNVGGMSGKNCVTFHEKVQTL